MRNSLLSVVRQITSSRQSPNRSALKQGVALEPLLATQPSAVSRLLVVSFFQSHLSILFLSNSSRVKSSSHHTTKLVDEGVLSESRGKSRQSSSTAKRDADNHERIPATHQLGGFYSDRTSKLSSEQSAVNKNIPECEASTCFLVNG